MIDKIKLKHFKKLSDNTISLNNLSVIAGTNSSGKSSLIQSIIICRSAISKLVKYDILSVGNALETSTLKVPLNSNHGLNLGNTQEVITRDSDDDYIEFTLYDKQNSLKLSFLTDPNTINEYQLSLKNHSQTGIFTPLKNHFYYLNAERLGPRLAYSSHSYEYSHTGWQGENTISILAELKNEDIEDFNKRSFPNSSNPRLINQVRDWMKFIIPNFEIDDADILEKIRFAQASINKSSPPNVGFGISYVLPIIVNALIAKTKSVYIVENPEAHLHPMGQSRIGQFLAFMANSGLQVIIETHSEHVINGIRLAIIKKKIASDKVSILFFSENKDGHFKNNLIAPNDLGDLNDYPYGFFDQEQIDIAEMIRNKSTMYNNQKDSNDRG
jgi:predicted ATPase